MGPASVCNYIKSVPKASLLCNISDATSAAYTPAYIIFVVCINTLPGHPVLLVFVTSKSFSVFRRTFILVVVNSFSLIPLLTSSGAGTFVPLSSRVVPVNTFNFTCGSVIGPLATSMLLVAFHRHVLVHIFNCVLVALIDLTHSGISFISAHVVNVITFIVLDIFLFIKPLIPVPVCLSVGT